MEKQGLSFFITDLIDELDFIKQNILLELAYFQTILDYIKIIEDDSLSYEQRESSLKNTADKCSFCYQQMKINTQGLKQLKKERRD